MDAMSSRAPLDLSTLAPARHYGIYPSPLAAWETFADASKKIVDGAVICKLAEELGYRSASSFTAAFKRRTTIKGFAGCTPTQWRELPKSERAARLRQIKKDLQAR
jgi:methylphosphotriester-DNA--protein-cysteine methyltransferase